MSLKYHRWFHVEWRLQKEPPISYGEMELICDMVLQRHGVRKWRYTIEHVYVPTTESNNDYGH